MADWGVALTGDRKAVLRFERFPTFAHDRLYAALQDIEARLEAAVISAEPSKTGELRGLTGGRVYDHFNRIAAVVGVRAETKQQARKAAALEYGAHDPVTVHRHDMLLAHFWRRLVNPRDVDVPAHTRVPNIAARRFLRGPLEAMRTSAIAEMQAAIAAAVQDAGE